MIPSESLQPVARPCLELAAELLTEWFGVSTPQAQELIATWTRTCRRSPRTVAEVLVHQVWQGDAAYVDPAVARTLEHALRNLPQVVADSMEPEPG